MPSNQDGAAVSQAEHKTVLLITPASKLLLTQSYFVWAWRRLVVGVITALSWFVSLLDLRLVMPTLCLQTLCSTLMPGGGGLSYQWPSKQALLTGFCVRLVLT